MFICKVAALNMILPPEYTDTFKVCQDSVEPLPFSKIEKEFVKELGNTVEHL
jgi:predicted unusual protein kinase regulating ubiquinone biosynthesis (AarF/ABC1/UbiB family)